jgi:hypothetical protein
VTTVEYPEPMARFRCNQQGCCCRGWIVPMQPPDLRRLIAHFSDAEMRDVLAGARFNRGPEGRLKSFTLRREGHAKQCQFLCGDGRCGLQVERGPEALASVCHAYPAGAVWRDEARQLFFDLCCPEVLERLDEADEALEIVTRDVEAGDHLEVRARFRFRAPLLRIGERPLSWEQLEQIRRTLIAAYNERRLPVLRTQAAAEYALWQLRCGAAVDDFALAGDPPEGPFEAYFERCYAAHDSELLYDELRRYERFVFAVDLGHADWRRLPAHLEPRPGWRALIDPDDPRLAPLLFRYLAHRAWAPFAVSYETSQVDLVFAGITHQLATALRLAVALCEWLELRDNPRLPLKIALGAAELAYRTFKRVPTAAMPWFDPDRTANAAATAQPSVQAPSTHASPGPQSRAS